jgi:hypothetical protein
MWPKTPVKHWYSDLLVVFTLLLALFTLILAVFTGVQVLAFVESERAELSVSGANILDENGVLSVVFEITNSGKSTAKNGHVGYYVRRQNLPPVPDYNNPLVMAFAPMVPGGLVRPAVKITPSEIEQSPFFIYGIITYYDAFLSSLSTNSITQRLLRNLF